MHVDKRGNLHIFVDNVMQMIGQLTTYADVETFQTRLGGDLGRRASEVDLAMGSSVFHCFTQRETMKTALTRVEDYWIVSKVATSLMKMPLYMVVYSKDIVELVLHEFLTF